MRPRLAVPSTALVLAALSLGAPAWAFDPPVNIAPFASLDVSRWSGASFGFSELEVGPGAVRDGDLSTKWIVPGEEGEVTTLTFDWSGPNGLAPFTVEQIGILTLPVDAEITVSTGRDLGAVTPAAIDVTREGDLTSLTLRNAPDLRVLRLGFPAGTLVTELFIQSAPIHTTIDQLTASCDDDGVHIVASGKGLFLGVSGFRFAQGSDIVRLRQRRGRLLDATVRFDPRPSTYEYRVRAIGSDEEPRIVSAVCSGPARAKPAPGPARGVVEGFYGRPWTWHERAKIIAAMGALGLDTYVYAPKNDPKHRDAWREPYDGEAIARFEDLASAGRGVGVDVIWAISPGLDIDAKNQADVDALIAKVAQLASAGVRDAALLMDDIDAPRSAALAQDQAALAAALLDSMKARDGASRLWFVPTVYAGLAGTLAAGDVDYLAGLAALPAEVPIAWTGSGVFAREILLSDAGAFAAIAGRSAADLWIWDNYPVNDVAVFHRLHTRPIEGRESLLPGSGGLLSNPMRHALASIPAIAAYAELALDPAGYAADRAAGKPLSTRALALAIADGEGPPPALDALFAELVHHDTLFPDDWASPELTAAIAAYLAAPDAGAKRRAASLDLATHLAILAAAEIDLRRDLDDQDLADEIDAYARATATTARAILARIEADRAAIEGDAEKADASLAAATCLWIGADTPSWRTIQDALGDLAPEGDTGACDPSVDPYIGPTPALALVGSPWTSDAPAPPAGPGTWSVAGAADATIGDDGRITFTPAKLGRHRLVALHAGDAGVTARVLDVIAVETLPDAPVLTPESGCACRAGEGGSDRGAIALALIGVALACRRARRRA